MNQNNYGGTNWQIETGKDNVNHFNIQEEQTPIVGIPNNLPYLGAVEFVGRQQELTELHKLLDREQMAIAAIHGMGGLGKTELALQYARQYQQCYPGGRCWLKAQESDVPIQIIDFARSTLGLPAKDFNGLDLAAQVRYCWSHWRSPGRVLLILDNVLEFESVQPYLPKDARFKVLMTTRLRLSPPVQLLEIQELGETAALDLLKSLVVDPSRIEQDRIEQELSQAEQLCQRLGYLPLGLELVGRYLVQQPDLSLATMLNQLQNLSSRALRQVEVGMTAERGLVEAFELSWQQLPPAARQLSYLLSLFAQAPVNRDWVNQICDAWTISTPVQDGATEFLLKDSQVLADAWSLLYRLSLLRRVAKNTYQLHQITREFFQGKQQVAMQENLAWITDLKSAYCQMLANVAREMPQTPNLEQIEQFTPILPHLEDAAHNLLVGYRNQDLTWAFLGIAWFYQGQGLYQQAEPWYEKCVDATTQRMGADHPDVATSLNNLAALYKNQGRYEDAEPLLQRSLKIMEVTLGTDHPHVATSLNNLAGLYKNQGRYQEAEPLYQRSLKIREVTLGTDHPSVATSLNNLAGLYDNQGRYEDAEPLYQRSLKIMEVTLGTDHPSVATSLNNLAGLYDNQGRYEDAEPLYQRSLKIMEVTLGTDHPSVATSLNNLAGLYDNQGRYEDAEPLFQRSLQIREAKLGTDHPDVAQSLNNLAGLYKNQGRYEDAEPLFQRSLQIREAKLGTDHPDVAQSLNNLAALYDNQGRYEDAEPLFQRSLQIMEAKLGTDHPDVAQSLNNLASLYHNQGRYEDAEPLYQRSLQIKEAKLGTDHPAVATSLNNLALLYYNQGRYEDAEPLYKRAISISEQKLGVDHPTTIVLRKNLQWLQQKTSQPSSPSSLSKQPKGWNWLKRLLP